MLQDTRIALFLLAELVAALQANDHDTFQRWLYGGIQDLGEAAVTELLLTRSSRESRGQDGGVAPGSEPLAAWPRLHAATGTGALL